MTRFTKLEHSAFVLENNGYRLAVDPGCMTSQSSREILRGVAAVLVTHAHGDHFDVGVLAEVAAPLFGPPDVAQRSRAAGIPATPLEINATVRIGCFEVTPVAADHGPMVQQLAGQNLGFLMRAGGSNIYVTGDVAGPQREVPSGPFAMVALPVEGGKFVFDPVEAAEFLRRLGHQGPAVALHADESEEARANFVTIASPICRPIILPPGKSFEF